jgi:hypothetical protein
MRNFVHFVSVIKLRRLRFGDMERKKNPQYFGCKISWKETAMESETCLKQNVDKSGTYVCWK